jgi:hypothetical protein
LLFDRLPPFAHSRAAHFDTGTFIIRDKGNYKLCEDIVFHPNGPAPGEVPAEDAFDPIFDLNEDGTDEYDKNKFGLGYFSAIAIATLDVSLYLDKFSIEQSAGHALFQRFSSSRESSLWFGQSAVDCCLPIIHCWYTSKAHPYELEIVVATHLENHLSSDDTLSSSLLSFSILCDIVVCFWLLLVVVFVADNGRTTWAQHSCSK